MNIWVSRPVQRRPYFTNTVTFIKYMDTMERYGYRVSTSPFAYQKDHFFCHNRSDLTTPVHTRRQIERMTPEDLEGELIARLFVL